MYSKQGWLQSKAECKARLSAKQGWVQSKAECNLRSCMRLLSPGGELAGRPAHFTPESAYTKLLSNAYTTKKCSQYSAMLTILSNAHNTQQCPQYSVMLLILSNILNTDQ